MGLTIRHTISFKGTADELHKKLLAVRNKCRDLPFEEVGEVEHILYSKEDMEFFRQEQDKYWYPDNSEENLAKRDKALSDRGLDIHTMIGIDVNYGGRARKHEFMKLFIWAGEGCESTDIEFFKKRVYWRCQGFTKTQYSTSFVKCHLLVINLFDIMKQEGFVVEIYDEGDYWETRSLEALAKSINEFTAVLQAIGGGLKAATEGTDITFDSAIDKCANIVKINKKIPDKEKNTSMDVLTKVNNGKHWQGQ